MGVRSHGVFGQQNLWREPPSQESRMSIMEKLLIPREDENLTTDDEKRSKKSKRSSIL